MSASPTPATAADDPLVLSEHHDGVLRLTLNRGRQRNPLSMEMLEALSAALTEAADDSAAACVVIAGAAPGFCAGHDLKQMTRHRSDTDGGRSFYEALFARCSDVMQAIVAHPRIIVAEVSGIATAAGCQLVAACDMAVAARSARFGVNGIDSGLFCSTPMVALSRNIGAKKAMELLTTGRLMTAGEAMEAGLVNLVADDEEMAAAVDRITARLVQRSSAVLALGKKAFHEQLGMDLSQAYAHTSRVIVDNMMMDDACEGIAAFLEKRPPNWKGS